MASTRWITRHKPHVCIIGAGITGLRCAEVLLDKGIEVTIFEGRDRIGGRVHQVRSHGHLVDMGANWIHGTDHNPILDLAKSTGTVTHNIDEDSAGAAFDESGKQLPSTKAKEISEVVWGVITDAFKHSNESKAIPYDKSLKDFFYEELSQKDLPAQDKKLVLQMAEQWGAFIGSPLERQSLRYFWLEECIDGENWTYQAILKHIAQAALEKANLHLSTTITSISTKQDNDSAIRIQTSDPSKPAAFDAIVLTASLGCLKAHKPSISPPLPERLETAIQELSYGNLEKVYLTFPNAYWENEQSDQFPSFVSFIHPTYARLQNPDLWNVECMPLSCLPEGKAHPTLLFYIQGPFAKMVVGSISDLDPKDEAYLEALTERFRPYFSKLPNYSPERAECNPVAACATTWSADELAGHGSYSNFQIPQSSDKASNESSPELDKDIEALRHGCPERGLWLAGEHTAPFVALGTVTGAYWSGEAVAERITHWFEGRDDSAGKASVDEQGLDTVQIGKGLPTGATGLKT